mmetsp:Transcript_16706/g.54385  ORF Transcript_16706/g.54385 Transcript_16706/m.54385 type:complete len:490 (+) Transcript_16706:51-1520(+)
MMFPPPAQPMWSQQQQFPNQFTPQGPPPDSRGGGGYVFPQQQQQRPHHQQQRPPQNNNNNKGPPYDSSLSSARTLWFGDLEAEWDEGYVRSLFRNNRVRVTMMRTHCFLEFESRDEAGATLQELAGRPIPGHPNKPFSLRWAGEKKKPVEVVTLNENSVFVGDLDYAITEAELLEAFRKRYPKSAVSAKIIVDQATQHSKGFGFVRFSSAGDRDRAIQEMHGQVLGDRPIRVTHASSREERGLAPNPAHVQSSNFPKSSYDPSRYAMPKATEEGENTCVFVGGLDESVTPEMLRHHFGLLGDIAYIRIPPGRGCGFVGFVHRKNAEAAISTLQGLRINGYKVRLSWGSMRNGARTAAAKKPAKCRLQSWRRRCLYGRRSSGGEAPPGDDAAPRGHPGQKGAQNQPRRPHPRVQRRPPRTPGNMDRRRQRQTGEPQRHSTVLVRDEQKGEQVQPHPGAPRLGAGPPEAPGPRRRPLFRRRGKKRRQSARS